MRTVMVASPKGGTGKSMVTTVGAMALGLRGVRVAVLDLSQSNPSQQYRSGLATTQPVAFSVPPVSTWPMERTSGFRVLEPSPESWSARSFDALVEWMRAASAAAEAAGIEVLVLDFDPLATNPLHVRALEIADDVVIVLDRSTFTSDNAEQVLAELQSPHPEVRHGFPFVGPERVAFLYCHTKGGRGEPAATRAALRGRGRWLGALSFSAALDRQGDLARLAYACPASVLEEMDNLVANLIPSLPTRPDARSGSKPSRRTTSVGTDVVVDPDRVLRVFGGPAAPVAMSVPAFQAFTLLEGWNIATATLLAERLGVRDKEMRRTVKELIGLGLIEQPNKKEAFLAPRPVLSDVRELREISRELATGTVNAERVVTAMRAITMPAYGGDDPLWAVHHGAGLERGVPLARQAEEVLLGVAEQAARAHASSTLLGEVAAALTRARVAVPQLLAGVVPPPPQTSARPQVSAVLPPPPPPLRVPVAPAPPPPPPPASVVPEVVLEERPSVEVASVEADPSAAERGEVPLASADGTSAPVDGDEEPANSTMAPVAEVVPTRWRIPASMMGVSKPTATVRVFGTVGVEGVTRGLSVPVLLSLLPGAMPQSEVCRITGYSESAVSNTFTTDHPVVGRERGLLYLQAGVMAEHVWLADLVAAAGKAVQNDSQELASALVVDAWVFAESITGRPFAQCPPPPKERGGGSRDVWRWVDEPLGDEWLTPRQRVGQRLVEALVIAARMWREVAGREAYPAELVIDRLCAAAKAVPAVPVPTVKVGSWTNSAEVLLLTALAMAATPHQRGRVHTAAAELIRDGDLDDDDDFAGDLGLPDR